MTNPFGITEVDIPGALGAYEAGQTSRVNRLLRMQQMQQAERQAERDAGLDQVIARVTGQQGKTGAAGAYQSPSAPTPAPGAAPSAPAPTAPPASQGLPQLSQEDELALRMGGERGVQIATAIRGMNDQQRELTNRRAAAGGQVAQQLLAIPDPQQRSVALQHSAPILLANGFTQDEINGYAADLSDASLGEHLRNSRLVAAMSRGGDGFTLGEGQIRYDAQGNQVAAGPPQRRRWFPVQPGGTIIPEPEGPAAAVRPPSVAPGTTETYNGRQYRLNQQGQWEDVGPAAGATQAGAAPPWPTPYQDPNQPIPGGRVRKARAPFVDPATFTFGRMSSGRRTPEGNRAVGGVPNSRHLFGDAADFVPARGQSMRELYLQARRHFPGAHILNEGDHVHVDQRGYGQVPYFGARGAR